MRHSPLVAVLTVVAIVLLSSGPAAAQAPPAASDPPRTADGRPDLSGVWDFRTVTPLERPSALADKAFFTEEEAAAFASQRVEASNVDLNRSTTATDRRVNGTIETIDLRSAYNNFWYDRGDSVVGTRRTSLVVDPPDGRIPDVTPQARERAAARAARSERISEGPEDRSLAERCIMGFNSGPPIAPAAYNQNVQIFQTPNTVVLLNEMVHNARLVPLDGRPHGTIRQWAGDSRGRWEGDTLVVETRNFLRETSFRRSTANLRLVERFTRVDQETLLYEFTVEDPTTWTQPWTAEIPMRLSQAPMFEYACHEGNYGMEGTLSGARAIERDLRRPLG
ncbi:MAG: hypothetical protein IH939_09595 [Acidobacteria bacterium]|nr:hypothetical protein [Acidobacteriota bacterium]